MIKWFLNAVYFVQIASSTFVTTPTSSPNSVKVYTRRDLSGDSKTVDVSHCVSLLGDPLDHHVASIDTMGSCAIVYNDYSCLGNGSLAATYLDTYHHNTLYYGFTINSLGPCRANCSSPKFEHGLTEVTISTNAGAEIYEKFMLITGECMNFPNAFVGTKGQISLSDSSCIQLYEEEACKGSSKAFQSFSKYKSISENASGVVETIYDEKTSSYEIQPEKWQHSKSISLCDFNCIGTKETVDLNMSSTPTTPPTTTMSPAIVLSNVTEINREIGASTIPTSTPPTQHGHIWLWVISVIVFLSVVTAAEVFRRYRNFKRQNHSSNEFTNFLSQSNRDDSL